ncbi:GPW/gp25 family protein [Streptomyces sp. NPDC048255]|uniref:GPW/gp25 family protein n=1 Tax=Streptomyces sp. NPDC048255 TaxID=3154713 RepID=UPI00340304E4
MTVSTGTTGGPGPLDVDGPGPAGGGAQPWLGTGVRFPVRPRGAGGGETGALAWVGGEALIRQSIETILDTEPGERVMRPSFGCGLRRYLMAPNTAATRTALSEEISEALTRWEPRIRVTEVAVTPGEEPTLVWIDIAYVRLVDLRPDRLVYPFYLR